MFPNRVPMERDTPSPEPLVHSFIHSFIYVCRSPQKGALLHTRKNIRSPPTEPHADGRPTYSGVRPGSPRVFVVLYDGGRHKEPKLVAPDKWMSKSVFVKIKTYVAKVLN
jgi:hypothetical protein